MTDTDTTENMVTLFSRNSAVKLTMRCAKVNIDT